MEEQSLSPLWKQFSLKINSFAAGLQENFLPPQDTSGWGVHSKDRSRAVAREVMGVWGGSNRGCLEAAKGRDNQGLSLTHLPALESGQGLFVPNTLLKLSQSFPLSDLQPPCAAEATAHPTTREAPFWPVAATSTPCGPSTTQTGSGYLGGCARWGTGRA